MTSSSCDEWRVTSSEWSVKRVRLQAPPRSARSRPAANGTDADSLLRIHNSQLTHDTPLTAAVQLALAFSPSRLWTRTSAVHNMSILTILISLPLLVHLFSLFSFLFSLFSAIMLLSIFYFLIHNTTILFSLFSSHKLLLYFIYRIYIILYFLINQQFISKRLVKLISTGSYVACFWIFSLL